MTHSLYNPLKDGKYITRGNATNMLSGDAKAICKNGYVKFYRNRKIIFMCNSIYAAAHFKFKRIEK